MGAFTDTSNIDYRYFHHGHRYFVQGKIETKMSERAIELACSRLLKTAYCSSYIFIGGQIELYNKSLPRKFLQSDS